MDKASLEAWWSVLPVITLAVGVIGGYLYGCRQERKHRRTFMKKVFHIDINENED